MPQDQKDPRQILTNDDGQPAVDMARGLRRLFEADPAGAVQRQVDFKLTELSHRGLWQDLAQEGVLRRLLTRHYQTDAGIADPRHLSNQESAELALAFRDADTAGRIGLLKTLESEHGTDFPAVTKELFEALPLAERPGASRIAAQFLEDREAGVEPLVGAQIAGLPEDLKANSEQVAAEGARANVASDKRMEPGDVETQEPEEGLANAAKLNSEAFAAATLESGIGITGDWAGPAFPQDDAAFLAALVGETLRAERHELPDLIDRINAAFDDDPATAQRLVELARMRFAEPEGFQGQFGLGRRQEAERELRLRRDRLLAGQDYHTQRHFDRAAFARAEAVSGLRLQLQENGSIAIGEPGEVPLVTVGWSVASAMVRNPNTLRERLALLERLTTSTEPLDEQIEQINLALGFSDQVDIETPTTDEEDTRNAILAANAAIREGKDPITVRTGLIGILFPEVHQDPIAWSEVLLDILPVIGEVRAVIDTVESLDVMVEALVRGDLEEASRQGLLSLLNAAGFVPVMGPLFKTVRASTRRVLKSARVSEAIRSTKIANQVDAIRRLQKALDRKQSSKGVAKVSEIFKDLDPPLTVAEAKTLRGLVPKMKGEPIEAEIRELAEILGVRLAQTRNEKTFLVEERDRVLDLVAVQGIPPEVEILAQRLFLRPFGVHKAPVLDKIRSGTGMEIKEQTTKRSKKQKREDRILTDRIADEEFPESKGGLQLRGLLLLREGLHEIGEKHVVRFANKLLQTHSDNPVFKRQGLARTVQLEQAFIQWVRDERKKSAGEVATLGEAVLGLALAASGRLAGTSLESSPGVSKQDSSTNQPQQ